MKTIYQIMGNSIYKYIFTAETELSYIAILDNPFADTETVFSKSKEGGQWFFSEKEAIDYIAKQEDIKQKLEALKSELENA